MKKDEFQRILDEYSLSGIQQPLENINFEGQLEFLENQQSFEGNSLKIYLSTEYNSFIPLKTGQDDHRLSPYLDISLEKDVLHSKQPDRRQKMVGLKGQKQQKVLQCKLKEGNNVTGDASKPHKNQYDKNIFANICKTILKQMLSSAHEQQIREYCLITGVEYEALTDIFNKMDRQCIRMGTSELNHFLRSSRISLGFRKVFSYFFVRFLRDEYLQYVIHNGKMSDKVKYLRCASKMMYIPRLSRTEYCLLTVGYSAQHP